MYLSKGMMRNFLKLMRKDNEGYKVEFLKSKLLRVGF